MGTDADLTLPEAGQETDVTEALRSHRGVGEDFESTEEIQPLHLSEVAVPEDEKKPTTMEFEIEFGTPHQLEIDLSDLEPTFLEPLPHPDIHVQSCHLENGEVHCQDLDSSRAGDIFEEVGGLDLFKSPFGGFHPNGLLDSMMGFMSDPFPRRPHQPMMHEDPFADLSSFLRDTQSPFDLRPRQFHHGPHKPGCGKHAPSRDVKHSHELQMMFPGEHLTWSSQLLPMTPSDLTRQETSQEDQYDLLAADRALRSIIFFAFCLIVMTTCCQLCRTPPTSRSGGLRRRRRRRDVGVTTEPEEIDRPTFAIDDVYRNFKVDVSDVSKDKKQTLLKPSAPPA